MINSIKEHWPIITALGILWATIAVLLVLSIRQNQGHFVYPLDDSYIHMSMAKNFAQHGVWSINKCEFTSSSSSLLWTLILSLTYYLIGPNEFSPVVLSFISGSLLIFTVYFLLRKYSLQSFFILIILLAIILFASLPLLIFSGLEHTMHALLTILFVYISAKILSAEKVVSKDYMMLLIVAPLLTMTRYEGLFLVLVVIILFVVRKRLVNSILLGGLAVIPIAIYGVISIIKGWYFLPNSVLLKGNVPSFSMIGMSRFINHFYEQIVRNQHILILLSMALFLFIFQYGKQKIFWKEPVIMLSIFITTTLFHLLFARVGGLPRYDAYLVALGILVIAFGMREYLPQKVSIVFNKKLIIKYAAIALLIFIMVLPFAGRGVLYLRIIPQATTNIYEQQYQMGLFLNKFYQGESVAANDIGAINYLADIKCLDLWGLGSSEVAELMIQGRYNTQQIYDLAKQKQVKIAVVYDHWFKEYGGIPPAWIKAGEWKIPNNIICGGDTVSFYAVNTSEVDNLNKNLRTFSSFLPKDVMQSGDYTK
ncbi:MAG: hypothetical protein WAV76_15980 [Bacteroidota bacterium]